MLIRQRHPTRLTVPRLGLLMLAVAGAVVAFAYPPSSFESSDLRCRHLDAPAEAGWEGVERLPRRLDDGRLIVVEQCRRWIGWRRWRQRVQATIWRGGERRAEQTLFRGVTTRDGVEPRFRPAGSPIEIRYDCGDLEPRSPAPDTCSRRWRWSDNQGKLIATSPVR